MSDPQRLGPNAGEHGPLTSGRIGPQYNDWRNISISLIDRVVSEIPLHMGAINMPCLNLTPAFVSA